MHIFLCTLFLLFSCSILRLGLFVFAWLQFVLPCPCWVSQCTFELLFIRVRRFGFVSLLVYSPLVCNESYDCYTPLWYYYFHLATLDISRSHFLFRIFVVLTALLSGVTVLPCSFSRSFFLSAFVDHCLQVVFYMYDAQLSELHSLLCLMLLSGEHVFVGKKNKM